MQEPPPNTGRSRPDSHAAGLRSRLAADLAAGRTIALTAAEAADPHLREELPDLLEELRRDLPASPIGLRIPNYTVLGEIGSGGMSTVYLARHDQLGRHVALKVVPHSAGGQERARHRLLKEARAMARLSHPHIVTVFDVVEAGDIVAIAMEWVDGLTLAGILRLLPKDAREDDIQLVRDALGTPPGSQDRLESTVVRTFVRMVHDIARAAGCAHAAGLLHLDIKPSNVLVRRDGTALLADFGLVREIDLSLTSTQSFAGTPIYAAPEQLRQDDDSFGETTDVYALGMTLYELLARSQPLRHEGLTEMLRRIEAGRVPKLSTKIDVARDLENIVHKAIAVEPQNRYASAEALADDLLAFLDGRPVAAQPTPAIHRLRRWMRAEPWKATLLGVLLVIVPVLLGLGTKLLLELPGIEQINRRKQRSVAISKAQTHLQSFLMLEAAGDKSLVELRRARSLDSEDSTLLACFLTLLGQDHAELAAAELDRLPESVRHTDGIVTMRRRFAESRPFFDDTEAVKLAASNHPLDLLLVALDQVLRHRDTLVDQQLELAAQALQQFHAVTLEKDPLTVGLEAWVAASLGDEARTRIATTSLAHLWPDNEAACLWRMLAIAILDPEAAIDIGRQSLVTHPTSSHLAVRTAGLLLRAGRPEEALQTLEQAPAEDPAGRQIHNLIRAHALHRMNRGPESDLALAQVADPLPQVINMWFAAVEEKDPDRARRRYMEIIERDDLPAILYHQAINFSISIEDPELHDTAVMRAATNHPKRATFRWHLAFMLGQKLDWGGVAAAIDGLVIPKTRLDHCCHYAVKAHCHTKQWERLLEVCRRWNANPHTDTRRESYYLAIALSRTGSHREAYTAFQRHLDACAAAKEKAMAETPLEMAWLQVMPDGAPELRDPARALEVVRSRRTAKLLQDMPRAWFHTIAAEIWFANGDTNNAVAQAEEALRLIDQAYETAPADLQDRLEAALVRYRR